MLGKRRWLSLTLVASLATFGLGLSAGADTTTEAGFVAEINASRAAQGLAPLTVDGRLRTHARNHTQDMMDAGKIYHSTGEELSAAGSAGWTKIGENVGMGGTVVSLHDTFMNSPGHRDNILGTYNYVGVGTATFDGTLFVTVMFMENDSLATTTTTAAPAATTTTAKATTTTTTSAPATTTTTHPTTTTTDTPNTTTTLDVGPDKPVIPGESCLSATRSGWMCHD